MIGKLNHVAVAVPDLEKAARVLPRDVGCAGLRPSLANLNTA